MKKIFLMFVATGCFAAGCTDGILDFPDLEIPGANEKPITRVDIPLSDYQKELAAETVDFSVRFLQEADKNLNRDNIILSPLSASFALSMLANGAAGETRQEIVDALGFEEADINAINDYSRLMLETLPYLDNTSILSFANSLWLNSGYGKGGFYVYDSFEKNLEAIYDSEIHSYNFKKGPGLINAWCSKKTNNLISKIIKDLNPKSQMVLVNALYFKGVWKEVFDEKSTKEERFYIGDGNYSSVNMMNARIAVSYYSADNYSLADLPLGNSAFNFQIVLPEVGVSAENCLKSIDSRQWLAEQKEMKTTQLEIKLPKFKVDMNESISEVLKSLGIKKMLSAKDADFSNLSDEASVVSNVQHATSFSLDEKGVEAAAITDTEMDRLPGLIHEHIPFHVNRPFLFVLKEKSTNSILFIGKITKL